MHTRSDKPYGIVSRKQLSQIRRTILHRILALLHRSGRAMQAFPELWIKDILSARGYYDF